MIIAAAIQLRNGEVYVGKRHGDCLKNCLEINRRAGVLSDTEILALHKNCAQGFITDKLCFLTRDEATFEAKKCNQIASTDIGSLLSEDLW